MGHGGARPGAGRKPGALTQKTRELAERAAEGGITPLDFMLSILRDTDKPEAQRFEAAKHAAPYIHPKLSAVELEAAVHNLSAEEMSEGELLAIAAGSRPGAS